MFDSLSEPESQVFVLRCWREGDSEAQPWRLQVEHVPSGKRIPLADLALLRPLLEEYLHRPAEPPIGEGESFTSKY